MSKILPPSLATATTAYARRSSLRDMCRAMVNHWCVRMSGMDLNDLPDTYDLMCNVDAMEEQAKACIHGPADLTAQNIDPLWADARSIAEAHIQSCMDELL